MIVTEKDLEKYRMICHICNRYMKVGQKYEKVTSHSKKEDSSTYRVYWKVVMDVNRYRIKYINGMHYVVDTKREDVIVSSGYHSVNSAETVCDKKNMNEDLCGMLNIKL